MEPALSASDDSFEARSVRGQVWTGATWGALVAVPAIFAAMLSGGAGHGGYIAARLLFPFSMLLTLLEGYIGIIGMTVAVLQFPLYGATLSRSVVRKRYLPSFALAALHSLAAIMCFSDTIPSFS